MKFCLSAKQTKEYLSKADEIMFMYSDRKGIKSYFDEYPEATIILRHDRNSEKIDWKEIKALNSVKKKGFVLCLDNIQDCLKAKEEGIDFYHVRPVTNYYDFQALHDLGVKYVYIAAPLFFDLAYLPMDRPEVRVYANEANVDGLPRANGVCGPWIRPEDLDLYDDHIDVVEFFLQLIRTWIVGSKRKEHCIEYMPKSTSGRVTCPRSSIISGTRTPQIE